MTPPLAPEVTVWTSAARAPLAAAVIDLMGAAVHPIGVAGPRSAAVDRLAAPLGLEPGNDFRQLRVDRPAAFILLTTLDDVPPAELRAAVASGTRLVSLEPLAAGLAEAGRARFPGHPGAAAFAPAFVHSLGYRAAADPQESIGPPRLVRMTHLGAPDQGSLLARLLDAWTAVLRFAARPEAVTATLSGPADDPRAATGFLSAHARVPAGPGVVIEVSDRAARPRRELSVLADAAQLRLDDTGYDLHGIGGRPLDDAPEGAADSSPADSASTAPPPDAPPSFARCVADQWRRLIDRPAAAPESDPVAADEALACTQACLLSARTGQPEDPGHLLRLAGR